MLRTYLVTLLRPTSLIILLVLAALSVVFWLFGGTLAIKGVKPFADASLRVYIIIGVFVFYLLVTFLRHLLARRANARLINSMLANDELVSMGSDFSSGEIEIIRERFEKTLKTLRDNPVGGRRKRDFIYDMPWYIIIGPPGTGKTTILRNSGLNFPLAVDGDPALQGIGGTRNCDWWISDEAVLIDTAGRYTTQDINAGIDAAAWNGFLGLLKQHRRRRPINGVLLAVSIADVVLASDAERQKQAETLRQRLRELHRTFGMRLPVYLLFTKCDLIAGFEEFFDETQEEEREQIWGMTFDRDHEQMTFGRQFESGFTDLVARLERRLPLKLAAERSNSRRCRIYLFPHEFGSMASTLRGFVTDVFRINRSEAQPLLRGVYFTSGTQEGTPFDRLLGAMGRSFSLAPSQQLPMSGQGKAFFIRKLLTDIIFAEQNLVGRNTKLERRLATARYSAYAALVVFTVALSGFWLYGLSASLAQIKQTNDTADTLRDRLGAANLNRSLNTILPALDTASALRDNVSGSFGWFGQIVGIDARPQLASAAGATYDNVLGQFLLPTVTRRLQTQVQLLSSSGDNNNLLLRDQLETYLMLTTGQNFAKPKVEQEFAKQNDAAFALNPADHSRMDAHMEHLITLLPERTQPDSGTVGDARERLSRVPPALDIYRRMVTDADRRYQLTPISIVNVLGTSVLRADTAALGGNSVIPGFYTKNGFYNFFLPRLPEYIRNSTGTDWVLGNNAISNDAYNKVAQQIVAAYVKDYIASWRSAIGQVRVIDFDSLSRAQMVLQELSNPQSPLTALLNEVRENTELPLPAVKEGGAADEAASQAAAKVGGPAGLITAVAGEATDAMAKTAISTAFGNAPWPGTPIGDAFRPLNSLVDPQNPLGSLSQVQQLFGDMLGTVASVTSAPDPSAAAYDFIAQRAKSPINDSFSKLGAQAATKPEPVRSMVSFVSKRTLDQLMRQSYAYINGRWQQEVVPACNNILADRYPFALDSQQEVSLQDFSDLFKPSGIIDKFFTDYLTPFVSVRGRQLTELAGQGGGLGLSKDSLAQFARAQTIRDAFFGAGGTTPQAKFTVEPFFLDPKALKSSFILDDAELDYRHGPVRGQDFTWPSKLDSSTATLRINLLDGTSQTLERTGNWAVFRMLSNSGLANVKGQDQFVFSIAKDKVQASFRLKAGSVTNPFNLDLYSSFRCPAAL
ncbi:type VI secretion system membrane subunit TssM [Rhizobium jaguaris]|uniref:Type VI secretion system membrane subunit TssM n=1 Tax=Rhizobium jaguaris TaxID=1312183 RepID=A0A387FU34_9HYPH|nr:type VI secretion system membrane subunit TssM [Rhizobium jaguaris]AYG61913.1 type VI secretion system membrane subunit TssM [Rhizobium jaguaris]